MSEVGDWLRNNGLDTFRDLLRISGHLVDYKQSKAASKNAAAVTKYGRRVDILNLALHRKHLDFDQRIGRQMSQMSLIDATNAERWRQFRMSEMGYHAMRRGQDDWLTGSRVRELAQVTARERQAEYLAAGARLTQIQGRRDVLTREDQRLVIERAAERAITERATATTMASRARIQTERAGIGERRDAEVASFKAGRARLGGEAELVAAGSEIRQQTRWEQARMERGAGTASGAARGMRGSFRQTTKAKALTDLRRDLTMFRLEDGLKMLDLAERAAKLEQAATASRTGMREAHRRSVEEGKALTEKQVRIQQGSEVARAGFRVERMENIAERNTLGQQERAAVKQVQATGEKRAFVGEEISRVQREGAVKRAAHSLAEAQSLAQGHDQWAVSARHKITSTKQQYEVWLGDSAKQIADWQLKNLPKLPDYEGMGARSALATSIRVATELID